MRSDCASPPPLVNMTYTIAGGMDTPTQAVDSYFDRTEFNDLGVTRRRRAQSNSRPSVEPTEIPPLLGGDRNGQGRPLSSPNGASSQSWGTFVATIVGGVAGKIVQFCRAGAFTGFYAGGGKGYQVDSPRQTERMRSSSNWEDVDESRTQDRFDRSATPVPGQYPEDDEIDWTSSRPAKRLHTENGAGWVMVSEDLDTVSPAPTSRLPPRRKTITTQGLVRPSLVSRRSLVPVSRRASGIAQSGSPTVHSGRPPLSPHKRSSSEITPAQASPLSPEAIRFMQDRRREERQADASIRRLNDQLKAMIQEGKAALGTKIEVLDAVDDVQMEDEGYFEDR
jgi:hypothetical protein